MHAVRCPWFCHANKDAPHHHLPTGCAGIANDKVVDIRTNAEGVVVSKSSIKHASKPTKALSSVTMKKKGARINRAVGVEVAGFRPDLKVRDAPGSMCFLCLGRCCVWGGWWWGLRCNLCMVAGYAHCTRGSAHV